MAANLTQTDVSVGRNLSLVPAPPLQLERGASVGRYVILGVVGEGGMGIVYAAYDPELDRKLALKLLRTASSERRAERRRLRLIREAQAMARLSHANVITVHDVGTIDDQVFVAMEFIEGCSLADWIQMDHEWRAVVEVFQQAGRGLAAAHAAGLIHRDFKPDNVMLTGEHRAVVTDFGLARSSSARRNVADSHGLDSSGSSSLSNASLSTTVTAAGAIMGTPAYMAPEQHEGREVDARSDQFAFAVALYEGLYGVRPFPGDDVASLAYNVGAGNVRPAPARTTVPTWLRNVLLKAMSVEPSNRYPSMVELLEALKRGRPGRRIWPWALAATLVIGGGGLAWAGLSNEESDDDPNDPCVAGAAKHDAVFGPSARAKVEATFAASSAPFASPTQGWPALDDAITRYGDSWMQVHGRVCSETEHTSVDVLAARTTCLEQRRDDVRALLDVFEDGDPGALERALGAVARLPAPERCRMLSPRAADVDRELRIELARVAAMARAGVSGAGLASARELVEHTVTSSDDGLHAQARLWLAVLERADARPELAEFSFKEATRVALRSGHDAVAADAAVALVELIGKDPARTVEAQSWAGVADALHERSNAPEAERAQLLVARAQMLESTGRGDLARTLLDEAAESLERAHGGQDIRVAEVWEQIARRALVADDPRAARPLFERTLDVVENAYGAAHPRTGALLHALAEVAVLEGDFEAAANHLASALRVREQGTEAAAIAETMLLQAAVASARGAVSAAEESLHGVLRTPGVPLAARQRAEAELLRLALRRGDVDDAVLGVTAMQRGGEDSPARRFDLESVAADALLRQGHTGDASRRLDQTIIALEARRGDSAPMLAEPLTIRGELRLGQNFPARALGDLERALSLRSDLDAYGTARTEFALARALTAVDPGSTRALDLARDALSRLDLREPLYGAIQDWIADR